MPHGEKITKSGAWALPPGFAYKLDVGLADAIALLAGRNATLLDVGSGKGLYVRALRARSIRAYGVEGAMNIRELTGGLIEQRELTQPFQHKCAEYEWVTCLEVAEHIAWDYQNTLLANLNCSVHATHGGLVLSWAPPGQFGTGHVNMRRESEVIRWLTRAYSCATASGECPPAQRRRAPLLRGENKADADTH